MPKKYKSRRTYLNARKRKEYNKYRRTFVNKRTALENKGLTPYDNFELSYNEYFAMKNELVNIGSKNAQREIIQKQIYKYSYEQSVKLRQKAKEYGVDFGELSLGQIRTGEDFDLSFLSDVNEELKKQFPKMTGKQRADYIRKEWFGYAS